MEFPHVITPASPADWAVATTLLDHYLDWIDGNVTVPIPDHVRRLADAERSFLAGHFGPPHHFLIARIGTLPAGILGARRSGETAELTRFFVRPVARGSGAARLLIRRMLEALGADGVERVVLDTVPSSMSAACRIYEDFGFTVTDTDRRSPGAVRMELQLGALHDRFAAAS